MGRDVFQRSAQSMAPTPSPALGNHPIPIEPSNRVRPPRVPSLEAFGRRPSVLLVPSRPAGIRNPSHVKKIALLTADGSFLN